MKEKFWVIAGLVVIAMALVFFISIFNPRVFDWSITLIGVLVAVWFIFDDDTMRRNDLYLYCLIIALLIVGFGFAAQRMSPSANVSAMGQFSALSVAVIQWPSRRVFVELFRREPETSWLLNRGGWKSFKDALYGLVLFVAMLLPALLSSIFN